MLINKIKHKIKLILLNTVQKAMREEAQNHHPNNQKLWFKKFGANSFFWGDTHYISGHNQIEIGENVHINNNSYIVAEGGLSIGDNTHISRNLTLYTRNHDYKGQFIPYDYKFIYKPVSIGKNVWIGMNVSIAPGTIIGDGCIIGIGSVVSGTVPALSIVGLPKCQVIGVRDEKHYQYREQNKLYGGANGFYYNWSNQKH